MDCFRTFSSVGTHSRQNDSQSVMPVALGHRSEHRVNGGAAGILWRSLIQTDAYFRLLATYGQVEVTRCDQNHSRHKLFSFHRFVDDVPTLCRKPLGQQSGEDRRHVLRDQNRNRKCLWNAVHYFRQRFGAAGRNADRHDGDGFRTGHRSTCCSGVLSGCTDRLSASGSRLLANCWLCCDCRFRSMCQITNLPDQFPLHMRHC